MRRLFHIIILSAFVSLYSCQREDVPAADNTEDIPAVNGHYVPGKAVVRMSEGLVSAIESGQRRCEIIPGVTVRRTFAHGGIYEERMRKAGLHLWYDVEFDESRPLTKTGESLLDVEGVDLVEYVPVVISTSDTYPFDDPDLKKQWHYYNKGNILTGLEKGCDINVFPAWERGVVGSSDVVVAVIDGGVDVGHDDLKDNLWSGTDTLGNTIHGYNFVSDTYTVTPDSHGTHVAGTIAAVNNNGIGVSGIAGGNAAEGIDGVRIMSCQIFEGEDGSGSGAAAIVWAANNGAVIAQNSWSFPLEENPGLTDTPQYVKTAVDYFNTFAGCDSDGNQLPDSPMKGGVVIFAAGNEAKSMGYPASYTGCVAVSSIAGDYELAYYSNFGDWVDIAAPGGDAMKNQQVYSTIPGNSYEYMQGTSMACPHVSGLAALLVSEFGGDGFTSERLREIIEKSCNPYIYDINPSMEGKLGKGMIDVLRSMSCFSVIAPDPVNVIDVDSPSNIAHFLLAVPEDQDDGIAYAINAEVRQTGDGGWGRCETLIDTSAVDSDGLFHVFVPHLEFESDYEYRLSASDFAGNESEYSETGTFRTGKNSDPVIVAESSGTIRVGKSDFYTRVLDVEDPDGHSFTVALWTDAPAGVTYTELSSSSFMIKVDGSLIPDGEYSFTFTVTDEYGGSATVAEDIVAGNNPPEIIKQIPDLYINGISESVMLKHNDFFRDEDGDELSFSFETDDPDVVTVVRKGAELIFTSTMAGMTRITVTAADSAGEKVVSSFYVTVRDASRPFDIYPDPAVDEIFIRTGVEQEYGIQLFNATGKMVAEQTSVISMKDVLKIDLTSFSPGRYSVRIKGADGNVSKSGVVIP